jgi:hypothetical protein
MLPRITTVKCHPGARAGLRHYEVRIVEPAHRETFDILAHNGIEASRMAHSLFDGVDLQPKREAA